MRAGKSGQTRQSIGMGQLDQMQPAELVEFALSGYAVNPDRVITVLQHCQARDINVSVAVIEALLLMPDPTNAQLSLIHNDLVQAAFFRCLQMFTDAQVSPVGKIRKLLYQFLDQHPVGVDGRAGMELRVLALKNEDLSAIALLARFTPRAIIDKIVSAYALADPRTFGTVQQSRHLLTGVLAGYTGLFGWHNNYSAVALGATLQNPNSVVPLLVQKSEDLPRGLVEIILQANSAEHPVVAAQAAMEALMSNPGWWSNPHLLAERALKKKNPMPLLERYLQSFQVASHLRIQLLHECLPGLIPEQRQQLIRLVFAFPDTGSLREGIELVRSGAFGEDLPMLISALTSNPLSLEHLHDLRDAIQTYPQWQEVCNPEFRKVLRALDNPPAPKRPQKGFGSLSDCAFPPLRVHCNWYEAGMAKEAGIKNDIGALMTSVMLAAPGAMGAPVEKATPPAQVEKTDVFAGTHFSAKEFACSCCGQSNMDPSFIQALEKYRVLCGNHPIQVNSGYRCEKHNREVGGASQSQHVEGLAADVVVQGLTAKQMYEIANSSGLFGGVGYYSNRVHLDIGPSGRRW